MSSTNLWSYYFEQFVWDDICCNENKNGRTDLNAPSWRKAGFDRLDVWLKKSLNLSVTLPAVCYRVLSWNKRKQLSLKANCLFIGCKISSWYLRAVKLPPSATYRSVHPCPKHCRVITKPVVLHHVSVSLSLPLVFHTPIQLTSGIMETTPICEQCESCQTTCKLKLNEFSDVLQRE